jgi:tRNA nucleotidyltransferase (CCA-adding enzyme)
LNRAWQRSCGRDRPSAAAFHCNLGAAQRFEHRLASDFAPDFCTDAGREGKPYPKAALLKIALKACPDIAENGSLEARQSARAEAIARAFRSERSANEVG